MICSGCGSPSTTGLYCLACVPAREPGLCVHCRNRAEGWLEFDPVCLNCLELVLEAEAALALSPYAETTVLDATAFLRAH